MSPGTGRRVVGTLYLFTAGVHLGIVAADAELYRHFADAALLPAVRTGWREIFMAAPELWGLAVMLGEALLGLLLLAGPRTARWGWSGVIVFHVLLMLFGVGFWLWSLPALALLVWLAHRDLSSPDRQAVAAAS